MPRQKFARWLKRNPFVIHKRSPIKVIPETPNLPYIGPHSSIEEGMLAKALTERGISFIAQKAVGGGRMFLGGAVVDFTLPSLKMYVRVQGEYWHGARGAQSRDDAQSILLRASGWRVVDVFTHDILTRLDWVMEEMIGQPAY